MQWVPNSAPDISALPPWFDAVMVDALADAVADRIADRLLLQSEGEPAWLNVHAAAEYLGLPPTPSTVSPRQAGSPVQHRTVPAVAYGGPATNSTPTDWVNRGSQPAAMCCHDSVKFLQLSTF